MANLLFTLLHIDIPMIYLHLLLICVATIFFTRYILSDTGFLTFCTSSEFVEQKANIFCPILGKIEIC